MEGRSQNGAGCPSSQEHPEAPPRSLLLALTQHALPQASQLHVGVLKGILHLLVQRNLLALNQDGGTPVQDALWGPLHHQHVALRVVFSLMDGQLERGKGVREGPSFSRWLQCQAHGLMQSSSWCLEAKGYHKRITEVCFD